MSLDEIQAMLPDLLIAFFGAGIALILRGLVESGKSKSKRKNLAALCSKHLTQILQDLEQHVHVQNKTARFNETNYCELVVGDFLYDLFTANIDLFPDAKAIENTTTFFHHYKVNMSTIKSRMDFNGQSSAPLTEETYNNLRRYLSDAITELNELARS